MGSAHSSGRHARTTSSSSDVLNASTSADFGYEEFGGRDGKTCPTCHGTGRISKSQSEELVALIPYSDKRLKPRRTCMYVGIAVVLSLIISGLILFFILPRLVTITEGRMQNYTVKIDANTSSTEIIVLNQFNITSTNFFQIKVTKLEVQAFFDEQIQVGTGELKGTPLSVPARAFEFPVNVTVKMKFDSDNNLEFISAMCKEPRRPHNVVVTFQATLTSEYMSHSEQGTVTVYKYIDCGDHKNHRKLK